MVTAMTKRKRNDKVDEDNEDPSKKAQIMSMKVPPLKSVLFSKILIIERTMKLPKMVRGGFVISRSSMM